jgi:hypothetical protein
MRLHSIGRKYSPNNRINGVKSSRLLTKKLPKALKIPEQNELGTLKKLKDAAELERDILKRV